MDAARSVGNGCKVGNQTEQLQDQHMVDVVVRVRDVQRQLIVVAQYIMSCGETGSRLTLSRAETDPRLSPNNIQYNTSNPSCPPNPHNSFPMPGELFEIEGEKKKRVV